MTDYSKMSIDDLFAWRDQWPAQRTEWNRAELALQKRLAVKYAYLDLAEELRDEGLTVVEQWMADRIVSAQELVAKLEAGMTHADAMNLEFTECPTTP